jgi:hypothetical protein
MRPADVGSHPNVEKHDVRMEHPAARMNQVCAALWFSLGVIQTGEIRGQRGGTQVLIRRNR